jgi:hypothetical protein
MYMPILLTAAIQNIAGPSSPKKEEGNYHASHHDENGIKVTQRRMVCERE